MFWWYMLLGTGVLALKQLPEEFLNATQLIHYNGFPFETHDVITKDGYILQMHRIPGNQKRNSPVLLQHGLLDSSDTWLVNGKNGSLAFVLAALGYDVWLGNSRGNKYSSRHVTYTTKDYRFWDFTFNEMAKYDLPACIESILKKTHQKQIYYVGHSQGTMTGFIEFSRNLNLGKKVKKFFALAPVARLKDIRGALRVTTDFQWWISKFFSIIGEHEFFIPKLFLNFFVDKGCSRSSTTEAVCTNLLFLVTGYDVSNFNETRLPVYLHHTPTSTSVKNIIHFSQLIKSGKFREYDYGILGNLQQYHSFKPPEYDVSKMQTPVVLFSGTNDWLSTQTDIKQYLLPSLNNLVYNRVITSWNHMDFVWGEDAPQLCYKEIVKLMKYKI